MVLTIRQLDNVIYSQLRPSVPNTMFLFEYSLSTRSANEKFGLQRQLKKGTESVVFVIPILRGGRFM